MAKQKNTVATNRQVRITTNALQNFNEVTGYIAFVNQQPLNAIKIGEALFTLFEKIGKNPFVFKECEEIRTKAKIYRRAVYFSWLVIYKITDSEIIILGIIHGARRPSRKRVLRKIK